MKTIKLFAIAFLALVLMPSQVDAQATEMNFDQVLKDIKSNSSSRLDTGRDTPPPPGGGDGVVEIKTSLPDAKTKLRPAQYWIHWDAVKGVDVFQVLIKENSMDADGNIYSANIKGNKTVLPLDILHLEMDKTYFVQVRAAGSNNAKSKKSLIEMGDKKSLKEAMVATKKSDAFNRASLVEKMVLKAMAMENSGYLMDAAKIYNSYMSSDKADMILRNMKDLFNKRNGIR